MHAHATLSAEALALYRASDVVDLHVDTFIWTRIFGYDLLRRHGRGLLGARFYGQADLPRLREAGVGGAIWSITTNPLRRASRRTEVFRRNLDRLVAIFSEARASGEVALCRDAADYRAARAAGRHAAFIGIQGGNALDGDLRARDASTPACSSRSRSCTCRPRASAPPARRRRRSAAAATGGSAIAAASSCAALDRHRVFVDLAHINRRGFFDAVAAHDRTLPLLVSHTGIAGVHRHWRNVDDEQLRAVADTGGVIGVMYQSSFLGEPAARRARRGDRRSPGAHRRRRRRGSRRARQRLGRRHHHAARHGHLPRAAASVRADAAPRLVARARPQDPRRQLPARARGAARP